MSRSSEIDGSRAVVLTQSDLPALARVRTADGIVVCEAEQGIWVSTHHADESVAAVLQPLPGSQFEWTPDGRLVPVGKHLATGALQRDADLWKPLSEWLTLRLPKAHWPGQVGSQVTLRLVASTDVQPASAMVCLMSDLRTFVGSVPKFRFQGLQFAANHSGEAFVVGESLPPIQGQRFWLSDKVAVPLGRTWSPQVNATCLTTVFGNAESYVLWRASGDWELIPQEDFTAMSRASVRASLSGPVHKSP